MTGAETRELCAGGVGMAELAEENTGEDWARRRLVATQRNCKKQNPREQTKQESTKQNRSSHNSHKISRKLAKMQILTHFCFHNEVRSLKVVRT